MSTLLDRITTGRPKATAKVTLAYDPTEGRKLAELRGRRDALKAMENTPFAKKGDDPDLADVEAELEELSASVETITIHLQGVGPARVEELMRANPVTPKQKKEHLSANGGNPNGMPQWDADKFPPALLAESVTLIESSIEDMDPQEGLTVEEATQLWNAGWSQGDKARILTTSLSLDQDESLVEDLGKD